MPVFPVNRSLYPHRKRSKRREVLVPSRAIEYLHRDRHARRTAMTTFNDREKAFENKFAHDEEMQFKAQARGNKLLGLWAAALLGKTGADADAYAMEVVRADHLEAGHEDVYRKLAEDLDYRADESTIRSKMQELLAVARGQILNDTGG
jgi:hypothetical protein